MARQKTLYPRPASRQWTRMTRTNYLTEQLKESHLNLDAAIMAGSWQAVALMRRQCLLIRAELDALQATQSAKDTAETKLTDDELVAALVGAIGDLPAHLLGQVEDALNARQSPQLRVVDGDA